MIDHRLGGRGRIAQQSRLAVTASRRNVVQDPFLVAGLFLDIFVERIDEQLIAAGSESRAGLLHQRHGVTDVVKCLSQIGDIVHSTDLAGQPRNELRGHRETRLLLASIGDQPIKELTHHLSPWDRIC